eukprot:gene17751-biopygen2575
MPRISGVEYGCDRQGHPKKGSSRLHAEIVVRIEGGLRWCNVLGAPHPHNEPGTTWFVISPKGVQQACRHPLCLQRKGGRGAVLSPPLALPQTIETNMRARPRPRLRPSRRFRFHCRVGASYQGAGCRCPRSSTMLHGSRKANGNSK